MSTHRAVTKRDPCPACGHGDWCARLPDGALRCERSCDPPAGFRLVKHVGAGGLFAPVGSNGHARRPDPRPTAAPAALDWLAESERCRAALTPERLAALADSLGVTIGSLDALGIGWASADDLQRWHGGFSGDGERPDGAFAFAERDGGGRIVGLSLRALDGRKGYPKGAHRGLIVPATLASRPDPVLIVEGASDCAALECLAIASVGRPSNSGGALELSRLLRGRAVVVIGENDQKAGGAWPGRDGALAVARRIAGEWGAPISWALPPSGSKDVRAWLNSRVAAGLNLADADACRAAGLELLAALEAAAIEERPQHEGEPTRRAEPKIPFPVNALPEPMRRFVERVALATGTDASYAATAALVTAAGCLGNRVAAIVRDGWTEPAVLWGALVGRSGALKSPVLKLVTRPLVEIYKSERAAFAAALANYNVEAERYAVRLAEWKKTQRNGAMTDPPAAPDEPKERRLLVSDVTVEKLGALLEQNCFGLLLVRDELAAWIGSFDRYAAGGKGSDAPTWLSFADAAHVVIDRKSSGTLFIERAAVSVLGGIQPGTLARVFGHAERESGLLARLLLAYPDERPARWSRAGLPDDVAAAWRELLASLLALPASVDEHGAPRPRFIPLGDDGETVYAPWHDTHAVETKLCDDDDLRAHFAKLKGMVVRIALVLACADVAAGGRPIAHIGADAMRRAILIMDWFKTEARRVYTAVATDEPSALDRLVSWIAERGGRATPREVAQYCRAYRTVDAARKAMNELASEGRGRWAAAESGRRGGRPTRVFELVSTCLHVYETYEETAPGVYETPPHDAGMGFCRQKSFVDTGASAAGNLGDGSSRLTGNAANEPEADIHDDECDGTRQNVATGDDDDTRSLAEKYDWVADDPSIGGVE